MANFYVDSVTGDDGDNGTTMALAWASLDFAVTQTLGAGDIVWVRRVHNEIPGSAVACGKSGSASSPLQFIGWPRDTHTFASLDWTHGSTLVHDDNDTFDREKHQGRYIVCPEGEKYLITRVKDVDEMYLDREYEGATVGNDGTAVVQADEDFATRPADTANWDDDADDLPLLNFNGTAFYFGLSVANYVVVKNLEFRDSTYTGIVYVNYGRVSGFVGCLFYQGEDKAVMYINLTYVAFTRCIFEGDGAGVSQRALACQNAASASYKDCAMYNFGDNGMNVGLGAQVFLENVNIGVEIANGDDDITIDDDSTVWGRDVWLGGTNGYFARGASARHNVSLRIENYGKELGKHKSWFPGGVWESVTAGAGDPIPDQRAGGATSLIQITPNVSGYDYVSDWAVEIFNHEYEVDTTQRTWRYYVQTNIVGGLTASELWIKLEYVKARDDDSEYVIKSVVSDETIAARSGITDWSDYIEVPNITPAVTSKVRVRCYVAVYDAANKIWIDPKVVNP